VAMPTRGAGVLGERGTIEVAPAVDGEPVQEPSNEPSNNKIQWVNVTQQGGREGSYPHAQATVDRGIGSVGREQVARGMQRCWAIHDESEAPTLDSFDA
jgi:hypothetical protein